VTVGVLARNQPNRYFVVPANAWYLALETQTLEELARLTMATRFQLHLGFRKTAEQGNSRPEQV